MTLKSGPNNSGKSCCQRLSSLRINFPVLKLIIKRNKNLPITSISWKDAISFCNWLSEKEGLDSVYMFNNEKYVGANLQNNGYRLPTEAEWEWLARKAGRNSLTKFSWGKSLPIPKMVGNLADESVIGFKELYISLVYIHYT